MSHLDLLWSVFRSGFVVTPPKIDGRPHLPSLGEVPDAATHHLERDSQCGLGGESTPINDIRLWDVWTVLLIFNHRNCVEGQNKHWCRTKETNLGNSGVVFLSAFFILDYYFPSIVFFFFFNWLFATYFLPTKKRTKTVSYCCLVVVEVQKYCLLKPKSLLILVLVLLLITHLCSVIVFDDNRVTHICFICHFSPNEHLPCTLGF